MRDTQSRKYLITINNPFEHGYTRDNLRQRMTAMKPLVYFCAAEEVGLETGTHHIHIYMAFRSPVRFSTMRRVFSKGGDIETARGTSAQVRDYVAKTGKWADDEKADTRIEGTFEEWGTMPNEHQGVSCQELAIIERVQEGASNAELLFEFPQYLRGLRDIEYVRQTLREEECREKWRAVITTYIFGDTGLGKTRSVMDTFGYANVYAVNDYKHPFDGYRATQGVLLFDEFSSSIRIQDMNVYLDGYPVSLPARYVNRQACYERVFIISNLDLRKQYVYEQEKEPSVWAAFLRRIHKVIHFLPDGTRREYATSEYMGLGDSE